MACRRRALQPPPRPHSSRITSSSRSRLSFTARMIHSWSKMSSISLFSGDSRLQFSSAHRRQRCTYAGLAPSGVRSMFPRLESPLRHPPSILLQVQLKASTSVVCKSVVSGVPQLTRVLDLESERLSRMCSPYVSSITTVAGLPTPLTLLSSSTPPCCLNGVSSSLGCSSQIIKSSERAWPIIYFVDYDPIDSSSMIFGGFTEALTRTTVHTKPYFSVLKRFFTLCLSVDSPLALSSTSSFKDRGSSSPEAFSMRSAAFPAVKQLKLSKFLTVLLSCGATRTGSEDTTDFVSTIFRGVNWLLLTSRFSVTMFYSGFAVNLVLTHSSCTLNSLSFYPRGFSTSILYAVLSYCNASRARIISSSKCSPIV